VVLLRAAGIPAQYVTGYLVDARAGQTVTVTTDQAHAWVEVFINGVGWVALEPTPGYEGGGSGQGGNQGGTEKPGPVTKPTEPSETEPVETEPTEPVETEPVVTTKPGPTAKPHPVGPTTEATEPTETEPGGIGEDTTTAPATEPDQGSEGNGIGLGGADGPAGIEIQTKTSLWWLLLIPALLLAAVLQWRIRLWLLGCSLNRGDPNRQTLCRWHLAARMAGRLKEEPEEDLYWLAQKARFSQHTVTAEELARMDAGLAALRNKLRTRSLFRRLADRLIFALY
jgi:hypothetical protein